jgi:hypothetical protein
MTRVQNRFLTEAILAHRSRGAIFERTYTRSAERFRRNEPDRTFATLANREYTLTLYVVKELPLFRPVNFPEPEVIFISQH